MSNPDWRIIIRRGTARRALQLRIHLKNQADKQKEVLSKNVGTTEILLKGCVDSLIQFYTFIKKQGLKVAYM